MTLMGSDHGFIYTILGLGASHVGFWPGLKGKACPVASMPRFDCYSPVCTGSAMQRCCAQQTGMHKLVVEALLIAIYSTWGRANTCTHKKSLSVEYLSRPIIADPCPAVPDQLVPVQLRYTNVRVYECTSVRMYECTNVRVYECTSVRACE